MKDTVFQLLNIHRQESPSIFIHCYTTFRRILILCDTPLTPFPTAGKHRPHHSGSFTRLPATMIVADIQAQRRVTSVVPTYEALCV